MTAPKRIQMSRQHPWRRENPDAVIVARPSRWGNPYCTCKRDCGHMPASSPERAVELYRRAIQENDQGARFHRDCPTSEYIRAELVGKDLACWCAEDQPCHASVLLDIANGGAS